LLQAAQPICSSSSRVPYISPLALYQHRGQFGYEACMSAQGSRKKQPHRSAANVKRYVSVVLNSSASLLCQSSTPAPSVSPFLPYLVALQRGIELTIVLQLILITRFHSLLRIIHDLHLDFLQVLALHSSTPHPATANYFVHHRLTSIQTSFVCLKLS
jgi:hypothetical protein